MESLEPDIKRLKFTNLCILLGMADEERKANVLSFCDTQSTFKSISKTKGRANQINWSKTKAKLATCSLTPQMSAISSSAYIVNAGALQAAGRTQPMPASTRPLPGGTSKTGQVNQVTGGAKRTVRGRHAAHQDTSGAKTV